MHHLDFFESIESQTTGSVIGFNPNYNSFSFKSDILPSLTLPQSLASIIVTDSRLQFPKSKEKQLTIPKNPQIFVNLPTTKGAFEVYMLPAEVNDLLTKFAQQYLQYQFTIKFIQYIENPQNKLKPLTSDSKDLLKALVYFRDNSVNIASLDFKLRDAEKTCVDFLSFVTTRILLKPDFLGWKNANGLVKGLKPQLNIWLDKFFKKVKAEILRQSGFREVIITAETVMENPEVKAMLDVLVFSEGTGAGYGTIVNGVVLTAPFNPELIGKKNVKITDFSRHPQILVSVTGTGKNSTAAGRYQFKYDTWKLFGGESQDFSPRSQDLLAVRAMIKRGMIDFLLSGDIKNAIYAGSPEWASLPMSNGKSRYGQPVKTIEDLIKIYNQALFQYKIQ